MSADIVVLHGSPDAEELAAVVAVLHLLGSQQEPEVREAPVSLWRNGFPQQPLDNQGMGWRQSI